jgi:hypothetical protein
MLRLLRNLASSREKEATVATVAVSYVEKELAFYEDWLKTLKTNEATEWKATVEQMKLIMAAPASEKSAEQKCIELNMLILKAQLERQSAKSIEQDQALSLGKLTRITPEMINVIRTHCADIKKIKTLSICDGVVNQLPTEIKQFDGLKTLHLSNNAFVNPPSPGYLPSSLTFLNLNRNPIEVKKAPHYPKELSVNYPVVKAKAAKKN